MNKIMIVDDEPHILILVRSILEMEGYEVVEAQSGKECLTNLKKEKPDMILLDIRMPEENGWEICKKIKRAEETKDIPVAMFTVRSSKDDIKKSRECGADTHISKPFNMDELQATVKKLLEKD